MAGKKPKIYAHRGGRKWGPENTMSVFRKSLEAGVGGIELDVHRTSTGELVVLHWEDLSKTTSGKGLVKNATWDEVKKLSAGSWFGKEFDDERVPLLSEVLDLTTGRLVLNIEVKNAPTAYDGIEDDIVALLSGRGHESMFVISSFDHAFLKRFHAKAPQYRTAVLINGLLVDLPAYAREIGATVWHPQFVNLRADSVRQALDQGLEVNAWTLNEIDEWKAALEMELDGIVTDDPEGLKQFLAEQFPESSTQTETPDSAANPGETESPAA